MGNSSMSSAVRSGKITVPSLGVAACAWAWVDATLGVVGTITASARNDNLIFASWTNDHELGRRRKRVRRG